VSEFDVLLYNVTNCYNHPIRRLDSRGSVTCGLYILFHQKIVGNPES